MAFTTWSTTRKNSVTLSGGNLVADSSGNLNAAVIAADPQSTGKYYYEITQTGSPNGSDVLGLATGAVDLTQTCTNGLNQVTLQKSGGTISVGGVSSGSSIGAITTGNLVCFAIDVGAKLFWARKGAAGNWNGSGTADPATGAGGISFATLVLSDFYPLAGFWSGGAVTANFGASGFTGTVPSGFTSGWTSGASVITNLIATQAGVITWTIPNPNAIVTQAGSITWSVPNPIARLTQVGAEAWVSGNAPINVTQVGAEAWLDLTWIVATISGVSGSGAVGTLVTAYAGNMPVSGNEMSGSVGAIVAATSETETPTGLSMVSHLGSITVHAVSGGGGGFFHAFP